MNFNYRAINTTPFIFKYLAIYRATPLILKNDQFRTEEIAPMINNDNRTEWSPIRSVIIKMIDKIGRPRSGVPFVNHEYDYRLKWTKRCPATN